MEGLFHESRLVKYYISPDNEDCRLVGELVLFVSSLKINLSSDSVAEIDLTTGKSRRARICSRILCQTTVAGRPPRPPGKTKVKVGHKYLGSAVESIGDHLAVRGTRDLDASALQASKPGAGGEQCHEGSTQCARSPE